MNSGKKKQKKRRNNDSHLAQRVVVGNGEAGGKRGRTAVVSSGNPFSRDDEEQFKVPHYGSPHWPFSRKSSTRLTTSLHGEGGNKEAPKKGPLIRARC